MAIEDFKNKIIEGDCLEVTREIGDCSIDAIITDPPYNLNYAGRGKINKHNKFDNDNLSVDDYDVFVEKTLEQAHRVLKEDAPIFIWIDWRNYDVWFNALKKDFTVKNCIVWVKNNFGMGQYLRYKHEFCIFAIKGNYKINTHSVSDVWEHPRDSVSKYKHPTQKPVGLITRCCDLCPAGG